MIKNKIKIFVVVFAIIIVAINFNVVSAKENFTVVTLSQKGEKTNYLFNDKDGLWIPGKKIIKSFCINNDTDKEVELTSLSIKSNIYDKAGNLLDLNDENLLKKFNNYNNNLLCRIYLKESSKEVIDSNFLKLINCNVEFEPTVRIKPGKSQYFNMEISLNEDADKSIMGLKNNFELIFKLEGDETQVGGISTNWTSGPLVKTGQLIDIKILIIIGFSLFVLGFLTYRKVYKVY